MLVSFVLIVEKQKVIEIRERLKLSLMIKNNILKLRRLFCFHVYAKRTENYGVSFYEKCVKCGRVKE